VVAGTAPAYPASPPAPPNPFGGVTPSVIAAAYTNNAPGAEGTLLFDIDGATAAIYLQQPAAAGTLTKVGAQLGVTPGVIGFDIPTQRNGSNLAVLTNGTRLQFPRLLAGTAAPGRKIQGLRGAVRDLAVLPHS
jgi:hypothetical protein